MPSCLLVSRGGGSRFTNKPKSSESVWWGGADLRLVGCASPAWKLKARRSVHAGYLRSGRNSEGQDSTRNARTRAQHYFAINQVVYLKGLGKNVVISHHCTPGIQRFILGGDGEVLPDEKSTFVDPGQDGWVVAKLWSSPLIELLCFF